MKKLTINELLSSADVSRKAEGAKLLQLQEKPVYEDGKKTDKIDCYEATVILPDSEGAIMSVKVDKEPAISNIHLMPEVEFEDLTVSAWVKDSKFIELSFKARSIEEA